MTSPEQSPDFRPEPDERLDETIQEAAGESRLQANSLEEANRLYLEKVKELNALRRVGDALRSVLSVRKVCCEIVDVLVEEVGAENCSLMLLDREEGTLSLRAARGQRDDQARYFSEAGATGLFKLGEGVAGWVAEHAEAVLIADTAQDKRFLAMEAGGLDIGSLLCLPLIESNQVWGVLNLSHSDINAFTEDNKRILSIIAAQAGIALANVSLFGQLQDINEALEETVAVRTTEVRRAAGQLVVINRIAKAINSVIDPEAMFGVIVEQIRKLIVFDRACIATFVEDSDVLRVAQIDVQVAGPVRHYEAELVDSEVSRRLREGLVTTFDSGEKNLVEGLIDMTGLTTGVVVPLIFQENVKGALVLGSAAPDRCSSEDQALLENLSEHIAAAVEKSRLYNEVRKINEELEEIVADRTRELTESEARYRAIFEKSAEAVFLMAENGQIINGNDRWTRLTGMTPASEEILKLEAPEGGVALPLQEWTRKAIETETFIPELSFIDSGGTRRIIELRLNPIEIVGHRAILGVAHDITVRRKLEDQLLRSEKLAAMGTLAASVAHEINNPLEGIKNCLNLLKKKIPEGRQEEELVELVERGFTRIRDIVKQVLDFHRPAVAVSEPLDVNSAVAGIVGLFQNEFKNHGIRISMELASDLPAIVANKSRIEQVFTNIILNAQDAMSEGGRFMVTTSCADDEVRIDFEDTGHGIEPEDLKNVFEPFFTRKRSGKGTGLGLWVSHSVVQEHHGRLEIDSVPGEGTTISVILPVNGAAPAASENATEAAKTETQE